MLGSPRTAGHGSRCQAARRSEPQLGGLLPGAPRPDPLLPAPSAVLRHRPNPTPLPTPSGADFLGVRGHWPRGSLFPDWPSPSHLAILPSLPFFPPAATNQGQGGRWGHLCPAPLPQPQLSRGSCRGVGGRPAIPVSSEAPAQGMVSFLPPALGSWRPFPPQSPLPESPTTAPRLEPEARTPCSARASFLFCSPGQAALADLIWPPCHPTFPPAQAPRVCPCFLSDSSAKPKPGEHRHSLPCAAHGEGRTSGSKIVKTCSTSPTTSSAPCRLKACVRGAGLACPTPATDHSEKFMLTALRVSKRRGLARNLRLKNKLQEARRGCPWRHFGRTRGGQRRVTGDAQESAGTTTHAPRRRPAAPADRGPPFLMRLNVHPSLDPTILLLGVIQEKRNVSAKGPRSLACP